MRGLIGKKIGMTRIFDSKGSAVPVTVVEVGPCFVTQIKTIDKDGYDSIQIGYSEAKEKHLTKPIIGHLNKANISPKRILAEFPKVPNFNYRTGQVFNVQLFNVGEIVSVTGKSKGHGFSGTVKKYSFSQQRKTHGQGDTHRHVGSIGMASDPSRVFPGKKMPGRFGNKNVSIKSLEVMKVDKENNQLLLKGSIPGPINGTIKIFR